MVLEEMTVIPAEIIIGTGVPVPVGIWPGIGIVAAIAICFSPASLSKLREKFLCFAAFGHVNFSFFSCFCRGGKVRTLKEATPDEI